MATRVGDKLGRTGSGRTELRPEAPQRYYDRLRSAIDGWLESHTGPSYWAYRQVLFLLPDVFALVLRLARDPRVSFVNRLKLWGLTVYILSPVDINLDFVLPLGPLDDLALTLLVLDSVLTETPDHVIQENWPGDKRVVPRLRAVTRALRALRNLGRKGRKPAPEET